MPHETEADEHSQIEQIESLSKNICQSGKPVLWTMAGNIDKLTKTYHKRFFSTISVLALICDEDSLRTRMTEGRNIHDADWIQSSVDDNHYFKTHDKIGDVSYDVLNIEGMPVEMVAAQVYRWVCRKYKDMQVTQIQ